MTKREFAIAKSKERMSAAVEALRTSEGWLQWLKTLKHFHRYSFGNTLLIAMQYPEATRVAGAGKWRREFDRHIKKGSSAIWILAPMRIKDKDNPDESKLLFKGVKVFDVSQTEPNDLDNIIAVDRPEYEQAKGDSHNAHLVRCVEACERQGWPLSFEDISMPGVLGYHSEGKIVVQRGMDPNRSLRVLIHEMTHALGVGYDKFTKAEAECICDATTYIVGSLIGLDVDEETISYVAGWSTQDPEVVRIAAEAAVDYAHNILDWIEDDDEQDSPTEQAAGAIAA